MFNLLTILFVFSLQPAMLRGIQEVLLLKTVFLVSGILKNTFPSQNDTDLERCMQTVSLVSNQTLQLETRFQVFGYSNLESMNRKGGSGFIAQLLPLI